MDEKVAGGTDTAEQSSSKKKESKPIKTVMRWTSRSRESWCAVVDNAVNVVVVVVRRRCPGKREEKDIRERLGGKSNASGVFGGIPGVALSSQRSRWRGAENEDRPKGDRDAARIEVLQEKKENKCVVVVVEMCVKKANYFCRNSAIGVPPLCCRPPLVHNLGTANWGVLYGSGVCVARKIGEE